MPDFTQWNVPTPFTNVLFNPMAVDKAANDAETARQTIGANDIAMVGRAAGSLLNMSESDAAAAYPGMIADLQRQGFARNAPSEYPGHAAVQGLVQRGLTVPEQYNSGLLTAPGVADALKAAGQPLTFGNNGVVTGGGGAGAGAGGATGTLPETPRLATVTAPGGAKFQVAATAAERFQGLVNDLEAEGYKLDPSTSGGYNKRFIAGTQTPSNHAYGTAVDVNWSRNPQGGTSSDIPADLARRLAAKHGLIWGGDWSGKTRDPMHFEVPRGASASAPPVVAAPAAPPPILNPNAGPRVGTPPPAVATTPTVAPATAPSADPNARAQTDETAPDIAQTKTAMRLGGTDVAGPPGVVPSGAPAAPQPNVILDASGNPLRAPPPAPNRMMAGVGLPGVTIGLPTNGMAPPPPPTQAAAPVVTAAAPVPPPVTQAPAAAPQPRTGQNSPQFQAAMELNRRAQALDMVVDPTGRTKAMAASLRAQAALYMQADSVTYDKNTGIGTKAITGEQVSPAKPLPHYVWDSEHNAWVDTNASVAPVTPRAPSLTTTKEGTVIQSEPGGRATVVYRTDPKGVAEQAAAAAEGTATGTATAQALPKMMDQGRSAAQAIGNIDYGMSQLAKAKEGGINTGYFAPWLSGIGSLAKSIGGDTGAQLLGIDPAAVGNIQTARKTLSVVSGAILQQILGPGSAITNDKIEAFIHAQPGIETDPAAVERVLNWARSQFTYEREMASAAVKEARKPENQGRLPPGWQAGYFDDHGFAPIYDPGTGEMRQPEGSAPGREPPATKTTAAITAPPVNPSERTANTTYTTPKGPLKWTGTGWVAP